MRAWTDDHAERPRAGHRHGPTRGLVSLAALLLGVGLAHVAQAAPRIVIITEGSGGRIGAMLQSELQALGMDIIRQETASQERPPDGLTTAARRHGAIAAFRVLIATGRVEVWIADRVTGKVVLREVLAEHAGSNVDDSVVVLRAVELLRASLAETAAPHPPRGDVDAPAGVEALVGFRDRRDRFALALAPAVLITPGGASGGAGVLVALGWQLERWLELRALAGAALKSAAIDVPEGRVEILPRWLSVELTASSSRPDSRWRFGGGLGAAVIASGLRGQVSPSLSPPYGPRESTLISPAATVSLLSSCQLTRNLRVGATLWAAAPTRSTTIIIAGREAADYGRLIIAAAIGGEVVLP